MLDLVLYGDAAVELCERQRDERQRDRLLAYLKLLQRTDEKKKEDCRHSL